VEDNDIVAVAMTLEVGGKSHESYSEDCSPRESGTVNHYPEIMLVNRTPLPSRNCSPPRSGPVWVKVWVFFIYFYLESAFV
jgi:hypothetical protein